MNKFLPLACVLLAAWALPASAAEGERLEGCVDLSANHQGVRFGSQYLLVKDGDAHYRVGFGKSCDALARGSSVTISTDGQANRLCASGTKVAARQSRCDVTKVEAIDEATFNRYKRRR